MATELMAAPRQFALHVPPAPELALWCLPPVAFITVRYQGLVPGFSTATAAAAILGVALVLLAARRPDRALLALVIVLPFQLFVLSWLHARGMPLGLLRGIGYWKEAAVAGIALTAVRDFRRARRRLDAIDATALAFLSFAAAYALAPRLFSDIAPLDSTVRYVGFRQMGGFVLLALAARHLTLPQEFLRRLVTTVIGVAGVTAAIAGYEMLFSDRWNDMVVDTLQVPAYLAATDAPLPDPTDVRIYSVIGGREILRVGSVIMSLSYGFLLLPALGLLMARLGRPARAARSGALIALIGTALLMTQTRSAILGGGVIVAVIVFGASDHQILSRAARERIALLVVAGILLALPMAASGGLLDRFQGAATGEDEAQEQHRDSIGHGLGEVLSHPLGNGLGTTAGTGQRFDSAVVVADNSYLQIGNEIGAAPMVLFAVLVTLMARELHRRSTAEAVGIRAALIGTLVGAFFLQAWMDLAVSWTAFAVIGTALAARADPTATALGHGKDRSRMSHRQQMVDGAREVVNDGRAEPARAVEISLAVPGQHQDRAHPSGDGGLHIAEVVADHHR